MTTRRDYWRTGSGSKEIGWTNVYDGAYTKFKEYEESCEECVRDYTDHSMHKKKTTTEKVEPDMKSGNHFAATKSDDGEYSCSTCGAESHDYELFEEFGDEVGCLAIGTGEDPSKGNPKTPLEHVDVQRARQHIEDAKKALNERGGTKKAMQDIEAAKKALKDLGEAAEEVGYTIKNGAGETVMSIKGDGVAEYFPIVAVDDEEIAYDYYSKPEPKPSMVDYFQEQLDSYSVKEAELSKARIELEKSIMKPKKNSWIGKLMNKGV